MRRYPSSPYTSSFSFGPGGLTPALKALIFSNIAIFVAEILIFDRLVLPGSGPRWFASLFGLNPHEVLTQGYIWQLGTYMFLHSTISHVLFNMLALWMFGGELERLWGTRFFLKYYFVTGVGAGVLTVIAAYTVLPDLRFSHIVGASGAIYGLLLAYGMTYPERRIYMYFLFPIPAKYFVMIIGAIAFLSSTSTSGGVAHIAHLSGLVVGYVYLKSGRIHPWSEVKYRYLKWKINRVRKKFDVYQGGRADDFDRRVH